MGGDRVLTVLGWFVLGTLILAIARQLSEQQYLDLISTNLGASYNRQGWNRGLLERFQNPGSPADLLLSDVLSPTKDPQDLTAKTCYEKDFMAQTQKTGNYIQRTNNYRHGAPDNCSAPLTEFVGTFYQ